MKLIIIEKKDAGQRIDKYLKHYFPAATSSFLYKMLRKKNIELNQKKASGSELLKEGDQIGLFLSDDTIAKFMEPVTTGNPNSYIDAYHMLKDKISVLYENEHILLAVKDRGVLSQKADQLDSSVNEWIVGYLMKENRITSEEMRAFRPSICNRLDRNTGGIVICAKTRIGSVQMAELLKNRTLHKYYLCRVKGKFDCEGRYEAWLYKDEHKNRVSVYHSLQEVPENKVKVVQKIQTEFKRLSYEEGESIVEIYLITGKSHQIRAHLEFLGYPITGDVKYNGDDNEKRNNGQHRKNGRTEGQCLFAYRLVFPKLKDEFLDISEREFYANPPDYIVTHSLYI